MWQIYETAGIVWLRTGRCSRCGECCISGDPFNGTMPPSPVEGACPLFVFDQDGQGTCTDRENPYYLNGCNIFPTRPEQVEDYPSCTFDFVKVGT